MELKDFISNTIYEICMGIEDAKDRVYKELNNQPISPGLMGGEPTNLNDNKIDFDVSVTTTSANSVNGEAVGKTELITVLKANLGVNGKIEKSLENVNRISFSVPFFPNAISKRVKNGESQG